MTDSKEKATEEVILDAAMKIFTRRGYAGARMEEIAKEAGINRALLHYYYRDKETMFNIIFETRFKEFFKGFFGVFDKDVPLFERIRLMVNHEIDSLKQHPDLPRFVIGEIANQPDRLIQYGQKLGLNPRMLLDKFQKEVEKAASEGLIRPMKGRQLLISIISLCIYPFIARPIIKTMLQLDENTFGQIMEERKEEVYQFIIRAIRP